MSFLFLHFAVGVIQPFAEQLKLRLSLGRCQLCLELFLTIGGQQALQVADGHLLTGQLFLQQLRLRVHVLQLCSDLEGVQACLSGSEGKRKPSRRVIGPHPLYVHALGCELASSELLARVQLDAQLPDGGQI